MSCCGQTKHAAPKSAAAAAANSAQTLFEYQGRGPLALFGRATGARYHFPGPSARAYVDGRDARVMGVIAELRVVA
jgi:hypothetical protein